MTESFAEHALRRRASQPWLSNAWWDCLVIISPAFISSAMVLAFRSRFENADSLPIWAWVSFVLLVDVAHVYSTLFRTYLNRAAFRANRTLLLTVPAACWVAGSVLYSMGALTFWRTLAYLAVFHFVRQQYGFMALYSRRDPPESRSFRWLDGALLYLSTAYPIVYWHTHLPRNFNWFLDGDFFEGVPLFVSDATLCLYAAAAAIYVSKEILLFKTTGFINVPRNLILFGTALSWWVGIVALNSDMAFTVTNVVTHGVPYMALIWLYHSRTAEEVDPRPMAESIPRTEGRDRPGVGEIAAASAPAFFLFLALLAYLEEGFWDGLIWREHLEIFQPFSHLPQVWDPALLSILIPLLSLPQSTHYVLDGFIWKVKDRSSIWSA